MSCYIGYLFQLVQGHFVSLIMKDSYLKVRKNLTILGLFNSYILIVRFYNFEIVSKLVAIHRPVYAL